MMQQKPLYPLLALVCGGVGFFLRLWQNLTGFDLPSGLPEGAALSGWVVAGGIVLLLVGQAVVVHRLPREAAGGFTEEDKGSLPAALLIVLGVLLCGGAGVMQVLVGMARQSRWELLLGALAVLGAAALLPAAAACKRGCATKGAFLLVPVACFVLRLVLIYRANSVDPALAGYYVELLALTALVMAYYRLSAFGYGCGQTRDFVYWASVAVGLSMTALADCLPIGNGTLDILSLGVYGGAAISLLGLMLHRLRNRRASAPPKLPRAILKRVRT